MSDKPAALLPVLGVGAGAIVLLIIVAKNGGSQSTGTAFASADPNAVAAVEQGIGAQIAANNQAASDRAKIASDTILGLAATQAGLLGAQIAGAQSLEQTRLTTAAAVQENADSAQAATAQAASSAQATVAAAQAAGAAAQQIASTEANAQTTIAANQTTQAQAAAGAQKTSSFWSGLFSAIGSIFKVVK